MIRSLAAASKFHRTDGDYQVPRIMGHDVGEYDCIEICPQMQFLLSVWDMDETK
jgi:hypothetical protein